MWSIEDLKECGERFGWNTRRGELNWYVLEEDESGQQFGDSEATAEELFQLMKQYTSDESLDCYEEEMEAEWSENIHGFDYEEVVSCR
jgi:hypothetical protein